MTDYLATIAQRALAPTPDVQPMPASLLAGAATAPPWLPSPNAGVSAEMEVFSESHVTLTPRDVAPMDGEPAIPDLPKEPPAALDLAGRPLAAADVVEKMTEPLSPTPSNFKPRVCVGEKSPIEMTPRLVDPGQEEHVSSAAMASVATRHSEAPTRLRQDSTPNVVELKKQETTVTALAPRVQEYPEAKQLILPEIVANDTIGVIRSKAEREPRLDPVVPHSVAVLPMSKAEQMAVDSPLQTTLPETIVHVTIGRVEIRADVQTKTKLKESSPRSASPTLEEFLHGDVQPGRRS